MQEEIEDMSGSPHKPEQVNQDEISQVEEPEVPQPDVKQFQLDEVSMNLFQQEGWDLQQ